MDFGNNLKNVQIQLFNKGTDEKVDLWLGFKVDPY